MPQSTQPDPASASAHSDASDGVRLLSHRPSVLFKLQNLAGDGESVDDGFLVAGPGWEDRLKALLFSMSTGERASLFAVRLADEQAIPLPADTILARARTDWLPEFLSYGKMFPHFQPIVDLRTGEAVGREALIRGKIGTVELRGGELLAAAEAHDALFSFDTRARSAALELGLPVLPDGEILFVNLDPRAVLDVEGSVAATWPVIERAGGDPTRLCIELVQSDRIADLELLRQLAAAYRAQGARIALDDLSGSPESLACLEAVAPDIAKLDVGLIAGVDRSPGRVLIVEGIVECAHELGSKVVAEGVERVDQLEAVQAAGVDFGQGFYFGQPVARPLPVDPRLVRRQSYVP